MPDTTILTSVSPTNVTQRLTQLKPDQSGASFIEYIIVVGLVAIIAIAGDISRSGFAIGLVMAGPFRFHFNRSVSYGTAPPPPNGWTTIGDQLKPVIDVLKHQP